MVTSRTFGGGRRMSHTPAPMAARTRGAATSSQGRRVRVTVPLSIVRAAAGRGGDGPGGRSPGAVRARTSRLELEPHAQTEDARVQDLVEAVERARARRLDVERRAGLPAAAQPGVGVEGVEQVGAA